MPNSSISRNFRRSLALSLAFEDGQRRFQLRRRGGGTLDLASVEAVWWRRPQPFGSPAGLEQAGRQLVLSESTTAFQGLYQSLDAFWINEPARDAVAMHKPYQLALAQWIGLDIPPTLMTNDVEQARAFWRRHEGEVIYKQFLALPAAWRETRRLKPEDEAEADAIAHAPVIFQKHVSGCRRSPRHRHCRRVLRRGRGRAQRRISAGRADESRDEIRAA